VPSPAIWSRPAMARIHVLLSFRAVRFPGAAQIDDDQEIRPSLRLLGSTLVSATHYPARRAFAPTRRVLEGTRIDMSRGSTLRRFRVFFSEGTCLIVLLGASLFGL
jgi:hypothetical protein